jgi:hypothetical protein
MADDATVCLMEITSAGADLTTLESIARQRWTTVNLIHAFTESAVKLKDQGTIAVRVTVMIMTNQVTGSLRVTNQDTDCQAMDIYPVTDCRQVSRSRQVMVSYQDIHQDMGYQGRHQGMGYQGKHQGMGYQGLEDQVMENQVMDNYQDTPQEMGYQGKNLEMIYQRMNQTIIYQKMNLGMLYQRNQGMIYQTMNQAMIYQTMNQAMIYQVMENQLMENQLRENQVRENQVRENQVRENQVMDKYQTTLQGTSYPSMNQNMGTKEANVAFHTSQPVLSTNVIASLDTLERTARQT